MKYKRKTLRNAYRTWVVKKVTNAILAKEARQTRRLQKTTKSMGKNIAKVWTFQSSSGTGTYETLQYVDATTSCNCPGWTRRTTATGDRSCKHTRWIDQGLADTNAVSRFDYAEVQKPNNTPKEQPYGKKEVGLGERKFVDDG